ncbi:MAG: carboxymuconolactone decarboxylase family protein [Dehalococcoidales bacterium]|nr:carboxymuconolactone decarboxylase family protein [Dehalococcoidales bacterium]
MTSTGKGKIRKAKINVSKGVTNYLPKVYVDFTKNYPKISKAYTGLGDNCDSAGPLDKKMRRLIKLGIAIGANSEGAIRSHTRRALEEGISADEIRHVVLLSLTTAGFHFMIAAYRWVDEILEKNK